MVLSDVDLRQRRDQGDTLVWRMLKRAQQPASIDVRLQDTIRIYDPQLVPGVRIDPAISVDRTVSVSIDPEYELPPLGFALSAIHELIQVPNDLVGVIVGVSTEARRGIAVEAAGLLDPGYRGHPTLELFNMAPYPYVLRPGARIAQVMFFRLETACERPYGSEGLGSRYQADREPTAARGSR